MTKRAPITTHILDLTRGAPANDVSVRLYQGDAMVSQGVTDADGRIVNWQNEITLVATKYRLEFDVEPYFTRLSSSSFYEDVHISFRVDAVDEHYHVPLLLSPFGYSTYRGS